MNGTTAEPKPRTVPLAERIARQHLAEGERLDFAAEAILSPHPVLAQMLHALTMGGPRPRTQHGYEHPNHGVAVVTDRRVFVAAYGRAVMETPRSRLRVDGIGGTPVVPWADVRWGDRTVRTAFHWSRAQRDRFVELLGGV